MDIIFFPNGNTAVFENEEQVPKLQKNWVELFAEFLVSRGIDPILAKITMPNKEEGKIFKTPYGYSWKKPQDLQKGTQIIYVPNHADDFNHPDCEEGFVTSVRENGAFCRYWSKHNPGHLRTTANSEMTQFENLVIMDTHPQRDVNSLLRIIEDEER